MARIGSRLGQETVVGTGTTDGENVVDPRNIVFAADGTVGPAEGTAEVGTVETVKRRGRPPGSKNRSSAQADKKVPLDVNAVQFSLTGIHALLAAGLSCPELAMEPKEAELIAQAASNVARHYDLQASQKAMDWGNFVVAVGAFYGPRFVAIGVRKRAERNARRGSQPHVAVQPVNAAPAQRPPPNAKPSGAPLATHAPSDEERIALLNEVVTPVFN